MRVTPIGLAEIRVGLFDAPAFDYNASFASDGQSIVFTSERHGDGNSDVFRCRVDGTDIQPLVADQAVDDAAVLSPDGSRLAFVSTRGGYRVSIRDAAADALIVPRQGCERCCSPRRGD